MRVRPRTSGSITDLLLALACLPFVADTAPQRKSNAGGLSGGLVCGPATDGDVPPDVAGAAAVNPTPAEGLCEAGASGR